MMMMFVAFNLLASFMGPIVLRHKMPRGSYLFRSHANALPLMAMHPLLFTILEGRTSARSDHFELELLAGN